MIDWLRKIEIFAIANASVRTSQNLNPPAPLTILTTALINDSILQFKNDSMSYYSSDLSMLCSKDDLVFLLQRKARSNGKGVASSSGYY